MPSHVVTTKRPAFTEALLISCLRRRPTSVVSNVAWLLLRPSPGLAYQSLGPRSKASACAQRRAPPVDQPAGPLGLPPAMHDAAVRYVQQPLRARDRRQCEWVALRVGRPLITGRKHWFRSRARRTFGFMSRRVSMRPSPPGSRWRIGLWRAGPASEVPAPTRVRAPCSKMAIFYSF